VPVNKWIDWARQDELGRQENVMPRKLNRREFVAAGAAAGLAAAAPAAALGQAPTMMTPGKSRPVVVASANGHRYRNGGDRTCVETAFAMMTEGRDVLDALIAGVTIVELDPEDTSVGYGGLPNADGVVQLDASCMHGPRKRAGAVASLEGVRTPSLVAQKVMDETDHHLLVGPDAQVFARNMGFTIEDDLNTDARAARGSSGSGARRRCTTSTRTAGRRPCAASSAR
jgi:N4-(beta-N-acetylglucosaminyl)-L-asparaginase